MNQSKAAYFDRQVNAPWAAAGYGPEEMAKVERLFAESRIKEGMKILEPGCGTGRLTEILADRVGPGGLVVALDISPKMVKACRHRFGTRSNVKVYCTAVEDFSPAEGAFDLVICQQVFPHFDDKAEALSKMTGHLKPWGKFIVVHFINTVEINDLHRKAGSAVQNDMIPPPEEMERLFQAAGMAIELFTDDEQGYFLRAGLKGSIN